MPPPEGIYTASPPFSISTSSHGEAAGVEGEGVPTKEEVLMRGCGRCPNWGGSRAPSAD